MTTEAIKILISVLTPLTVALIGFALNGRLKSIDEAQWQSRRIIEKRLDLYDAIAPNMNKVYCFCMVVGYWSEISPPEALKAKRELDKTVNIYRHLLSEDFYTSYNKYIHTAFKTFTGHGKKARVRCSIAGPMADRRKHSDYEWKSDFDDYFDVGEPPSTQEHKQRYREAMTALRECMGIDDRREAKSRV